MAIKVLPEHFAEDEERLRRFEREATSLASLSHPNVAQIHSIDQALDLGRNAWGRPSRRTASGSPTP